MADKNELVRFLAEIAAMLELSSESTFKIRAYQNAARLIDQLNGEFSADGRLAQVVETKGIGRYSEKKFLNTLLPGG